MSHIIPKVLTQTILLRSIFVVSGLFIHRHDRDAVAGKEKEPRQEPRLVLTAPYPIAPSARALVDNHSPTLGLGGHRTLLDEGTPLQMS